MKTKTIETVIIGAGISGLSCARQLHKAKKNFLVISKDIGGRMKASESFAANYGAAYATEDYHHVLRLVKKGEPMKRGDFYFYTGKTFTNLFSLRNLKFSVPFLKLLYFAWRIRNHLNVFREKAVHKSMQECFEEDPWLLKYWLMPAKDFIKKHGLEEISRYVVDPVTAATAFVKADQVNTIYFVSMIFPAFLKTWIIDFSGTIEKLTKGYKNKIKIGEVKKVIKGKDGKYDIKTSIGKFKATNVVLAAPRKHLEGVYPLPKMNIQQDSYVFHVDGKRVQKFSGKKGVVFQDTYYDIHMLWRQRDDTDIIYTQHAKPNLKRYYENYTIIKKIHWQPAMVLPTCCLNDQELDDNLYLASNYSASDLEDSFISGLYAANQIIRKSASRKGSQQTAEHESLVLPKRKVRDPVCHMLVKAKRSLAVQRGNKTYFFCGKSCKAEFEHQSS